MSCRVLSLALCLLTSSWILPSQVPCTWEPVSTALGCSGCFEPSVFALEVFHRNGTSELVAGGQFNSINGVSTQNVASFRNGTWSPLGAGLPGLIVFAMTTFDSGNGPELYAGGLPASMIARWNGTSWVSLPALSGTRVLDFEVFDDGSGPALFAAGVFQTAGGISSPGIAKFDGTQWSSVGGGVALGQFNLGVSSLEVFDDGAGPRLYLTGEFTAAGGVPVTGIARWNGSNFEPVPGLSGFPGKMTVFDDGSGPALYCAGYSTITATSTATSFARYRGGVWTPAASNPNGDVFEYAVLDRGLGPRLYLAGYNVELFQLNGSAIVATPNSPNTFSGNCSSIGIGDIAVYDDGTGTALYLGGACFHTPATGSNPGVIRWRCSNLGPAIFATQAQGPGTPVAVSNSHLVPGGEYYNLFSLDLCPGPPGGGPALTFGLCVNTALNTTFLADLAALPIGTRPIHWRSTSTYEVSSPHTVPPITLDALCIRVQGSTIAAASRVVRVTVQ